MKLGSVPSSRGLKKIALWTCIGLFAFTAFGFFLFPLILKVVAASQLTKFLHREVTIQKVAFNPFTLLTQIHGFTVKDRDGSGPFVSFDELLLNLQAASVLNRGPVVRDIILKAPQVTIIRNEDLTYNFSDLLEELTKKPAPETEPPPEERPLHFSLNNIRVEGGSIDFDDRPRRARHEVRELNIGVPFLSNLPYDVNVHVQPAFAAKVNGTPIDLTGKTKPFHDSRETSLDVNISDIDVAKYVEYIPAKLPLKIQTGDLETKAALSFSQVKDQPPALIVSGRVGLKNLAATELSDRPLLKFSTLEVAIDSADVFAKKFTFGTVLLQAPEVHLRREKNGGLNVMALVARQSTESATASEENATPNEQTPTPLSLNVADVRLADGKVTYVDEAVEKPFQTTLEAINVAVRHFSNTPAQPTAIEASLKSEEGETIQYTGELILEPLKTTGNVELQKIRAKKYAPYYEKFVLFDVEDATLDLVTNFTYVEGEGEEQTALSGLAATLSSLRLRKREEKTEFLKIPALAIKDANFDLGERTVSVGEVSTEKGEVTVRRERDGTINFATLFPTAPSTPAKGKSSAPPQKDEKPSSPPWLVTLKKFAVGGYVLRVEDKTPPQPVTLTAEPVVLTVEDFSTEKDSKAKTALRMTLNKKGTLAVNGPVRLEPLTANLKVEAKGINLIPFQPYFSDKVNIFVKSGAASANGNLTLQTASSNDLKVTFTGQAAVTKLATVTKANAEDFLKWNSLSLNGIKVNTAPFRVDVKEVAVADFYSRLIVNPDATLNVQSIARTEAQTPVYSGGAPQAGNAPGAAATVKPAETNPIRIGKITLRGGTVDFSDRYIKPSYSAKLTQLTGLVSELSSERADPADVDLRGRLDDAASLEITGKINPFAQDLYVDLAIDFKDIDLNPMTPYVGKYAGYTVERGKLSLGLKYLIADRKLQAENKVFLDQFTFGDQTDSPHATTLPVRLAVSLLKDRSGAIRLDLPVTGSLDDPQFSVWGVIIQVVTNLIAKAATSPFALLGAALGGSGEGLSYVEFEYGRDALDSRAEEQLQKLASVLADRPALKLDISGRVDSEKDAEGLRQYLFERKLKAQKLNDLAEEGEGASPDEVKIEGEEYAKYLALAYKEETFPKPRNLIGLAKGLPDEEMEKLMLANIQVTDDNLRELAKQRARKVRDHLLKSGQIESERIFLVEPDSLTQKPEGSGKGSRVDFAVK